MKPPLDVRAWPLDGTQVSRNRVLAGRKAQESGKAGLDFSVFFAMLVPMTLARAYKHTISAPKGRVHSRARVIPCGAV
jgi:hypothetical protein